MKNGIRNCAFGSRCCRLVFTVMLSVAGVLFANPTEIHTVHAPFGIPAGTPATNDIIFRHLYTVSTNDDTKLADWVAFRLTDYLVTQRYTVGRNYVTDPVLDPDERLEERSGRGDYDGANAAFEYERGHLIPRAAVDGSRYGDEEVNYLSVLAPQHHNVNQGPWSRIETAFQRLAARGEELFVFTGPYYDDENPLEPLPGADEPHQVPNGYWIIVYTENLEVAAFEIPQTVDKDADEEGLIRTVRRIESLTGLDFFSLLDEDDELRIENIDGSDWYKTW